VSFGAELKWMLRNRSACARFAVDGASEQHLITRGLEQLLQAQRNIEREDLLLEAVLLVFRAVITPAVARIEHDESRYSRHRDIQPRSQQRSKAALEIDPTDIQLSSGSLNRIAKEHAQTVDGGLTTIGFQFDPGAGTIEG
jgi:hypothetical protein